MKIMHRIKVTSDGTPAGTTVTDTETGVELPCRSVAFDHQIYDAPTVMIEIPASSLEYDGLAEIVLIDEKGTPLEVVRAEDG